MLILTVTRGGMYLRAEVPDSKLGLLRPLDESELKQPKEAYFVKLEILGEVPRYFLVRNEDDFRWLEGVAPEGVKRTWYAGQVPAICIRLA